MQRLKRGYDCFLNSFIFYVLFCGGAGALPQDWTCEAIEVYEAGRAADVGDLVRVIYAGEKDGVRLQVEFYAAEKGRVEFDCGNQGCSGEFADVASGKREVMDFYCEEREKKRVFCSPVNWRMWRLDAVSDGNYVMKMCGEKVSYTLNLDDCSKEQCVLRKTAADGSEEVVERKCLSAGEKDSAMICVDRYEYEKNR